MFREEYPRPQFLRKNWINLNGEWNFEFDDKNIGNKEKWYLNHHYTKRIIVPFAFQTKLSGINDQSFHDYIWYNRKFKINDDWFNKKIILHFGAVDYKCVVYINGSYVISHIGGNTSFSVDITDYLNYEEEEITLFVIDPSTDQFIPRGKQYWKEKSEGIFYNRTSGIWQTVWLEPVDYNHIIDVKFTPNIDEGKIKFNILLSNKNLKLKTKIYDKNICIVDQTNNCDTNSIEFEVDIFKNDIFNTPTHNLDKVWSPENPYLFDVKFYLYKSNQLCDKVSSYFGMRKVHSDNGIIYLNNRPYYQKLVLDQGYWIDGLLTAPSDNDYIYDITMAKKMGFNGCRKHQKVEDPRFLYHADKLGFIVWGEMANCANYNDHTLNLIKNEWYETINRDYNHPCIITWVPLNESWGVPFIATDKKQQHHSLALYHFIHSLDNTRFVISNDGWELTKTDICGIHNYNHGTISQNDIYKVFNQTLENKENILNTYPAGRKIYANGFSNQGEPIILTEFGGIGYSKNSEVGWGYTSARNDEEFISEYKRVTDALKNSRVLVGFCYTQLYDVEQEINGLLTYDRKLKVDSKIIKSINDKLGNIILKNI